MAINWQKKKLVTLKWLGAGPLFLLYLIFGNDMKLFENSVAEGLFLSAISIVMPAMAVFLIYWPSSKECVASKEIEEKKMIARGKNE